MTDLADQLSIDNLFWRIVTKDDEKAFCSLFYNFFPSLCVYAGRYIDNKEECEDIVQDTFFKIWRTRKSLEITSSARNLLVTTVKNSCIDYLRKKEVEHTYIERQAKKEWLMYQDDVYSTMELEEIISRALSQLPENLRQVFEMNRFDGLTYAQIAEKQNISVKTVESYMSKSLKMMRTELKDYLPLILLFCW